jgi:hypothetical protein
MNWQNAKDILKHNKYKPSSVPSKHVVSDDNEVYAITQLNEEGAQSIKGYKLNEYGLYKNNKN